MIGFSSNYLDSVCVLTETVVLYGDTSVSDLKKSSNIFKIRTPFLGLPSETELGRVVALSLDYTSRHFLQIVFGIHPLNLFDAVFLALQND